MRPTILGLAAVLLAALAQPAVAEEAPKKKRILVITESKGFVHSVVNRNKKPLCLVEETFIDLAKKTGLFEVHVSQNSREEIHADNLKKFDAVFFYTTGSLPLSESQKSDLLAFVRNGGGFAGSHCATDTFYDWKEYGEMIGGYFDGHPWHQKVTIVIDDKNHPATKHLGDKWVINDEIYQFRTPYSREKLRVLMRLDPDFVAKAREQDVKKVEEQKAKMLADAQKLEDDGKKDEAKKLRAKADGLRPGVRRTDRDCGMAWVREYGKGRVFYTALGHREDVWTNELFQEHLVGGLRYVLRLVDADATPSQPPKKD